MPLTADASKNIAELSRAHAGERAWPRKRIIAAGLHAARTAEDADKKVKRAAQERALGG